MSDSPRPNIVPVVIGIALTALVLGFIAYVASARRSVERKSVPQLVMLAPLPGSTVPSPLVIRFTSSLPLELGPRGWGYRSLHLHAWVNGVQHMPAASDIVRVDSTTYLWTLPISHGSLELQIAWADQTHRGVTAGASETIEVTLR